MKRSVLLIAIILLFSGCKGEQQLTMTPKEVLVKGGVEIPIYDFKSFESLLHIDDGKVRLINFWATWCKPCIAELPYFELINSEYKEKGVEVLLVSLDLPTDVESKLIPFLKKQQIKSKVVLLDDPDANTWIPKVSEEWSGSIPATIIYKGKTRYFYERSFTYNELKTELRKMM
ncbi:TlpA disulfide reductase family protein [Aquimarina hainanensis]|uniref:TlpA disulfide reductase family protein n=1 Tax=Aquimarina hainanensis TaxID=1578017 RepID=A0ABW5NAU3_9FLAO|nr:TlpA disulfide reductase family protein [Aquimarina sp. TRL1]QKX03460.1 TlpA family protein disulfide reductase [Aquimarina sp. TRL1]